MLIQKRAGACIKFYTACFTALSFLFTSIVFPSALHAAPEVSAKSVTLQDFGSLKLPESLAKIENTFTGDAQDKRSVVVIQDAHSIPDAQRSIRKIILFLEKEYGAKLIGVEGASGDLDTRIFESYPDQEGLQKVFKEYMDKGEMTGSVAAAIFGLKKEMAARGVEFFGIENWPVYEEGLALYLSAMGEEEKILKQVNVEIEKVKAEKEKSYSKELLEVDQAQIAFEENSKDLLAYLKILASVKAPESGSEIALLLSEADQGQTGDAVLDAEVRRLAAKLKLQLGHLTPEGQKNFSEKFQAFQTSQLSVAQFALALKDLSDKEGFKLPMTKGMAHQAFNQRRMRDLEGTKLFKDIELYAKGIKESLFRNDIERQLDQRTHELILLTKWAKLELSREDWVEIKQRLADSVQRSGTTDEVKDSLSLRGSTAAEAISDLSAAFKYNKAFYENAEKRDAAFIQNLEKRLKPGEPAIMIAGGFHAQGLAEHLKEKGIDFALVMPNIAKLPEMSAYREHMKGNVDWKSYFEVKDGKINLYEAFVRYTRDKLMELGTRDASRDTPKDPHLLKNWRDQIIRNLADEGKLAKAGEYTRFIDETLKDKKSKELDARMQEVENFIAGLKDLGAKGQFTAPNIAKLLNGTQNGSQSNRVPTVPAVAITGAGDPSARLRLSVPALGGQKPTIDLKSLFEAATLAPKSEARAIKAETKLALTDLMAKQAPTRQVAVQIFRDLFEGIRIKGRQEFEYGFVPDSAGLVQPDLGMLSLKIEHNNLEVGSFILIIKTENGRLKLNHDTRVTSLEHQNQGISSGIFTVLREIAPEGAETILESEIDNLPTLIQLNRLLPESERSPVKEIMDGYKDIDRPDYEDVETVEINQHKLELLRNLVRAYRADAQNIPAPDSAGFREIKNVRRILRFSQDTKLDFTGGVLKILSRINKKVSRSELRSAAEGVRDYATEIEQFTKDYNAAVKSGDKTLAAQIAGNRLELAKVYVDVAVGRENPLIAKIVKAYLDHNVRTDVQMNILAGGAHAQKELQRIKEISKFENKSLTAGWMGSPDKVSRHDLMEALDLERQILEKLKSEGNAALYSDLEARLFSNQKEYWKLDTAKTGARKIDPNWTESDKLPVILGEANQLEEVMVFLLDWIAQKANLVPGTYEMAHRPKSEKSTRDKIDKFHATDWGKDATQANLFDLLGGRFVVSDLDSLLKLVGLVDEIFGFKITVDSTGNVTHDPNSAVVRKENKFVANRAALEKAEKALEEAQKDLKEAMTEDQVTTAERKITEARAQLVAAVQKADPYRAVQYTLSFPPIEELIAKLRLAGAEMSMRDPQAKARAEKLIEKLNGINAARGKDAVSLHTFELQLKTERVAPASDFVHEIGYKPNIEGMEPFLGIINEFSANALYDDYLELARQKGWTDITKDDLAFAQQGGIYKDAQAFVEQLFGDERFTDEKKRISKNGSLESEKIRYAKLVFQAIVNNDVDQFYNLVLSWYGAVDVLPNEVRGLIIQLVRLAEKKLVDYKNGVGVDVKDTAKLERQMNAIRRLEAAASEAYKVSAVNQYLKPDGAYFGASLADEDALELLPLSGRDLYTNRYKRVKRDGAGKISGFINKITASDLGLTQLGNNELFQFFRRQGKSVEAARVEQLYQTFSTESSGQAQFNQTVNETKEYQLTHLEMLLLRIMYARDNQLSENGPVVNLFHDAVEVQYERADPKSPKYAFGFDGGDEYRAAWLETLTRNQMGTVVSASVLSEMTYGPVLNYDGTTRYDSDGKPVMRDLMQVVVSDTRNPQDPQSFTTREMIINWFFMAAIRAYHDFADPKKQRSYKNYIFGETGINDATGHEIIVNTRGDTKVDKVMDHAVARTLIEDQLEVLRRRIGIADDVEKVAIDIQGASALAASRELIEVYFRTIGVDARILSRWMGYLDGKYAQEIDTLLTPGSKVTAVMLAKRKHLRDLASRPMADASAATKNMHKVFVHLLERVHERQAGNEDILLAMMPFMNLTYTDLREMAPEGAVQRLADLKKALIEHGADIQRQSDQWLTMRMNGPIADLTGVELRTEILEDVFSKHLSPLIMVLEGSRKGKWNKLTWNAYKEYSDNGEKYTDMNPEQTATLIAEVKSDVNTEARERIDVKTLEHMIALSRLVERVGAVVSSSLTDKEREAFALAVHNQGYAAQQVLRTLSPTDVLLPVEVNAKGSIINAFTAEDGTDVLTPDSRAAFDEYRAYKTSGKKSIPKVSLAGFKLADEADRQRILDFFIKNGKDPEKIILESEIEKDGPKFKMTLPEWLEKALTDETGAHRKTLSKFEAFNGFVRDFDVLLADAKNFDEKDQPAQVAFLYSKQTVAIAYVLLLTLMPSLLNNYAKSSSEATKAAFTELMNQAVNALWRVTSPWEGWDENYLISTLYPDLDQSQQKKDTAIWTTVLHLSLLLFDRLSEKQLQTIKSLEPDYVYTQADITQGVGASTTEQKTPEEFMQEKTKEGYYFIGITTASGKGIASGRVDDAKAHFKDAIRMTMAEVSEQHKKQQQALGIRDADIKPLKFIIVSGGTGNWNPGEMSGVDIAYDAANEMNLETMAIYPDEAFDMELPIRNVTYHLRTGKKFGDESNATINFSQSMIFLSGGAQAKREVEAKLQRMLTEQADPQAIPGILIGINDIETARPTAEGSHTAATDANDLISGILQEAPAGSVLIRHSDSNKPADETEIQGQAGADRRFIHVSVSPLAVTNYREINLPAQLAVAGRSEVRSNENVIEAAKQLDVPLAIKRTLDEKGVALILGAPGSGKSEQLDVALNGQIPRKFVLPEQFFEATTGSAKVPDAVWNRYTTDLKAKDDENTWLADNMSRLEKELLADPAQVIIFDEFDLSISSQMRGPEIETFKLVVELAVRLRDQGKKILLILHSNATNTPGILTGEGQPFLMKDGLLANASELIRTQYFSQGQELAILASLGISGVAAGNFIDETQGIPAAYLGFLEHAGHVIANPAYTGRYSPDLAQLRADAVKRIGMNYRVAKRLAKSSGNYTLVNLLRELALGDKKVNDAEVEANRQALLDTGLLGEREGVLVFSPLVKNVIAADEREGAVKSFKSQVSAMRRSPDNSVDPEKVAVVNLLQDLAEGLRVGNDPEVLKMQAALAETGLVSVRDGTVVMPGTVRDAINTERSKPLMVEGVRSVLLPLHFPANLTGRVIDGASYSPKIEAHATLFYATPEFVKKISDLTGLTEADVLSNLQKIIRELPEGQEFLVHATGQYEFVDAVREENGRTIPVHTVVERLNIDGFDEFYKAFEKKISDWLPAGANIAIPRVFPHVTRLQHETPGGIGVTSETMLRAPQTREEQEAVEEMRGQMRALEFDQLNSMAQELNFFMEELAASQKFTDSDLKSIQESFADAMLIHRAQRRKEGTPYFAHLIYVARLAVSLGVTNPFVVKVLALHDAKEDQPEAFLEIRERYEAFIKANKDAQSADVMRKVNEYSSVLLGVEILTRKFPTVQDSMALGAKELPGVDTKLVDSYFNQIINPRRADWSGDPFIEELSKDRGVLTDDFIRQIQLGKVSDFFHGLISMRAIISSQESVGLGYLNATESFVENFILGSPLLKDSRQQIIEMFRTEVSSDSGVAMTEYARVADYLARALEKVTKSPELTLDQWIKNSGLNVSQLKNLQESTAMHVGRFVRKFKTGDEAYLLGASVPIRGETPPLHKDVYEAYQRALEMKDWRAAYNDVGIAVNELNDGSQDVSNARSAEFLAKMIKNNNKIVFLMPTNISGHHYVENELRLLLDSENNRDLVQALTELGVSEPQKAILEYLKNSATFVFGARETIPGGITQMRDIESHFKSLRSEVRPMIESASDGVVQIIFNGDVSAIPVVSREIEEVGGDQAQLEVLVTAMKQAALDEIKRRKAEIPASTAMLYGPEEANIDIHLLDKMAADFIEANPALVGRALVFNMKGEEVSFSTAFKGKGLASMLTTVFAARGVDVGLLDLGINTVPAGDLGSFQQGKSFDHPDSIAVVGDQAVKNKRLFLSKSEGDSTLENEPYKRAVDLYARALFGVLLSMVMKSADELNDAAKHEVLLGALIRILPADITENVKNGLFKLDANSLTTERDLLFDGLLAQLRARSEVRRAA